MHISNFATEKRIKHFCMPIFNRATYGRSKSLIEDITKHPHMKLTVVLSSAALWGEFGKASDYIQGAHPNVELVEITKHDSTHIGMALSASEIVSKFARFYASHDFDAVIVIADRYETLPAALAASYLNIPLIHIQGGELTGNIDDRVRHSVTKLSDYHFVATRLAKEYVVAMGEDHSRVFNTGCPSLDIIHDNSIHRYDSKENYILCIFHPETENTDEAYAQTQVLLRAVREYCVEYGERCYWFYPNPDPGREKITELLNHEFTDSPIFIKAINKEPEKFLWQLAGARLIVGNSSCGIRESSYLGVPSVNVGDRQGIRERAHNILDATFEHKNLLSALRFQHKRRRYGKSHLFGTGRASEYIVKYLARIDFTLKGTLTYPTKAEFRSKHFGEKRFNDHKKRIGAPFRKNLPSGTKSRAVQSKPRRTRSKNAKSHSDAPGEPGTSYTH